MPMQVANNLVWGDEWQSSQRRQHYALDSRTGAAFTLYRCPFRDDLWCKRVAVHPQGTSGPRLRDMSAPHGVPEQSGKFSALSENRHVQKEDEPMGP